MDPREIDYYLSQAEPKVSLRTTIEASGVAKPADRANVKKQSSETESPLSPERDYIDPKIDAVRSELRADVAELRADVRSSQAASEARHAMLETKLDALGGLLQSKPDKLTVWGASLTVAGIIIAVMAFGGDRFDAGVGLSDHLSKQQSVDATQTARIDQQDAKLDDIDSKLDRVLTALEKSEPPAPLQQ